jgi:DNA-binding transcriptional LysR family regulator
MLVKKVDPVGFERKRRVVNVRVDGRLTYNDATKIMGDALDGFGLADLPEKVVREHIATGRLEHVLEGWCPPFPSAV